MIQAPACPPASDIRFLNSPASPFASFGPCIELSGPQGVATVALQGGHLISWLPTEGQEVFWLTNKPAAPPAALRGGVPICWPWFARQGVPDTYPQHGVVRTLPWNCVSQDLGPDGPRLSLEPDWAQCTPTTQAQLRQVLGPDFESITLRQTIGLRENGLWQELQTYNGSQQTLRLTQAMHSYFRVGDARQVQIDGLQNKTYLDKLQGFARFQQTAPFTFESACDRIYIGTEGRYTLTDPVLQRKILLTTEHSESLVVWNPGAMDGAKMADVGEEQWPHFFCLEASQAEPQGISLAPQQHCKLSQMIQVEPHAGC